jgi:RHS repeat-associated protein
VVTSVVFSGGTSVQEYTGASSPALAVEYVRGSDYGGGVGGILYTIRSGTPSYTHENRRGDVVAKTNASGSLTYQAQYEAFGNQVATSGSTLDRQKSNSKDTDPTNLVNEGFRYRDLETGSFITRDPAGMIDGPNEYTYVNQNPWTRFDPEGLFGWSDIGNYIVHMPGAILNDIKDTSQLGYMGAVVMTSSQTTVLQKIEGAAVMVSAVVDVASNFTGIEGAGKAVVKDVAKDVAKDAIKSAAKDATHDAVDSGVKTAAKEGTETGAAKIDEETEANDAKASSTPEKSAAATQDEAKKTSWTSTDRRNAWKDKGYADGKTPTREILAQDRKTGTISKKIESKELHHIEPRRNGGSNESSNLKEVWPSEHEAIDPHRHINYDVKKVLNNNQT